VPGMALSNSAGTAVTFAHLAERQSVADNFRYAFTTFWRLSERESALDRMPLSTGMH
jgi:hypothetical protein